MKLINFSIGKDNISIIPFDDNYLDIHNNYDFEEFNYNIFEQKLKLRWGMRREEWERRIARKEDEIMYVRFALVFEDVTFFAVRERDKNLPFTEDTCTEFIGFSPLDMRNDFDSFLDKNISDDNDMIICFQSEQALKINCKSIEFVEIFD
jgi:hypothetical protein